MLIQPTSTMIAGTGYSHILYGRRSPGCLRRNTTRAATCAMPWIRTSTASAALITSVSVNSEPIAVMRPMANRASVGKFIRGWGGGERGEEPLVARRLVGPPRATEQPSEHRTERRDHDRDREDLRGHA